MNRFPEMYDFVCVNHNHVDYYGYIDDIDYDIRNPRICIEFFPGSRSWFDMNEITFMEYPVEKKG